MLGLRRTPKPGRYSAGIARKAQAREFKWLSYTLGLVLLAVVLAVNVHWVFALPFIAGAFTTFAKAKDAGVRAGKARIGAVSERRVAAALKKGNYSVVINNAVLFKTRRGDADHVVLGPCAVVVETKTGGGKLRCDEVHGTIIANGRLVPTAPIKQVRAQAQQLSTILGVPTRAIVCIVDAEGEPIVLSDGTVVCSLRFLNAVLRRMPAVLTPEMAAEAAKFVPHANSK